MSANAQLAPFVMAAQQIIYDSNRAKQLLGMMKTKQGTAMAVNAVMAGIEQHKKLKPDVALLLGPIILMLLIDLGKTAFGKAPDKKLINEMIKSVMTDVAKAYGQPEQPTEQPTEQPAPQAQPVAPAGLINQGATA